MQRLMTEFAGVFDLDHRVRGQRLGDLIERTIDALEEQALPDWGSPGPGGRHEIATERFLDFYYLPHLFPGMDLNLRLAHKLQYYLLPRSVPPAAPLSIAAVLESFCHMSGDLFGWEMLGDGRFLIWIADVSGHGVRSGLFSAVLRVLVDSLRRRGRVESLAAELNDHFVACLRKGQDNRFATGFFLSVAEDGTARYVSAGHPPMLLRRNDGTVEELPSNGLPIGLFPDRRYRATEIAIAPGETLLLYTDGVVETGSETDEPFGLERLRGLLREGHDAPRSLTHSLYRRIVEHQDMDRLEDDVTFVAARRREDGSA